MKTRLGHYDIVAELGRGGMGVVYKGHESSLNRYVAIKVLADSLAHDEAVKERFLREARSMAALNDPHIIQIYFIGEDEGGQTYFVMEFVEGESLGSMLKREGKLSVEQSAKVIYQTALGLSTAHDRGVVHRDIKPGNLMINSRGAVKIADFGIALSNHDLSKKLTTTGEFVGTPGYLSPEVCLGKPVDQRSDIFSLGIVMFEMLTGRMPFTDESPLGLMLEVVKAEIPDVREINHDVDPEIARILDRMIAKDPAERYQNCHELIAELGAHPLVAKGGPISLQPKMSAAAATMIGQKTPVSAQTSLPSTPRTPASIAQGGAPTRVTPSGLPMPPAPPVAGATPHQSVLERTGQAPRRSALPWAIAAIVLLAFAGGAFAFRDRIPGFGGTPTSTAVAATTPSPGSNMPAAPAPPSAPPAVSATPAADLAAANTAPASTLAAAPTTPAAQTTTPTASADASTDASGAPAARASQAGVDALRDLPAAQAAQDAPPPQIATAKVPEKPAAPPKPRVPTIAVVVGGDNVISSPAEDAMVNLLQSRGFRVIEGGHTGGDRPNLHALSGRADAVVFVNARPVGTQEIAYYGQSSTLYTVQLGVKAYRVSDGSVMWTSSTEQVNFTSLNAAEKAREAIEPMLDTVDSRLAEFRSRGGRG
jgi:eukaryotic-like serine/threonine-protein kinase